MRAPVPRGVTIVGPCALRTTDRLPPHEPRRNQEALCDPKGRAAKLPDQRLLAPDCDRMVADFRVFGAVRSGLTPCGLPVTTVWG